MPVLVLKTDGKNLCGGIENEKFYNFLQICFSHATSFSLSKIIPKHYQVVPNAVEEQLSKHTIKIIEPQTWYGYPRIYERIVQTIYSANIDTLHIISNCYQDIFLRNKKKVPKTKIDTVGKVPKSVCALEDLCFWSDNTMILGTLSHEFICSTNIIDEEFADELQQVADWQIEDTPSFGINEVNF